MLQHLLYKFAKPIGVFLLAGVLAFNGLGGIALADQLSASTPYSSTDITSLIDKTPFYDPTQSPGIASSSTTDTGNSCDNLGVPTITDPQSLALAILQYISTVEPSSPFNSLALAIDIVSGATTAGINPLFVVAIAQAESSIGTQIPDAAGHNSFGREAGPGQPGIQNANGITYYAWSSFADSVDGSDSEPLYLAQEYLNTGLQTPTQVIDKYNGGTGSAQEASTVTSVVTQLISDAGSSITCTTGTGTGTGSAYGNAASCDTGVTGSSIAQKVVEIAIDQYNCWQKGTLKPEGSLLYTDPSTDEEWCADFVSWVYNAAGDQFPSGYGTADGDIHSVNNIEEMALHNPTLFTYHAVVPSSDYDPDDTNNKYYTPSYTPQPGDIVIHSGPEGSPPDYFHTNIVISVSGTGPNASVVMIGGDQTPPGGTTGVFIDHSVVSEESVSEDTVGYISPN